MIQSRLSILMAERNLKISDLYEETKISKTTLMAISENSGKGIQFETVDKLCNFLGVTPCEFFDYAPYIVDVKLRDYKFPNHDLQDLEVIIKNQNYEKAFILNTYSYSEKMEGLIPLRNGEVKLFTEVILGETEFYNPDEFYKYLGDLSISFRTEFMNKLVNLMKEQLLNFIDQELKIGASESVKIQKGDYIALRFFADTKYEFLKKFTLK
ncbi:helix-turn-helix domain-containing protein [Staphylococcus hominis]